MLLYRIAINIVFFLNGFVYANWASRLPRIQELYGADNGTIAGSTKALPPGVGLAMVTTVGYAGFMFGPPVIGFVSDLSNLRTGLLVVCMLFVLMTILGFIRNLGAKHNPELL